MNIQEFKKKYGTEGAWLLILKLAEKCNNNQLSDLAVEMANNLKSALESVK